jgi:hypothetical protein
MARANVMERYGKLTEHDRSFDIEYWQAQEPKARMDAAWEMIVHACRAKGMDVRQLRLQRSVEHFQRQERQVSGRRRLRRDATHRAALYKRP